MIANEILVIRIAVINLPSDCVIAIARVCHSKSSTHASSLMKMPLPVSRKVGFHSCDMCSTQLCSDHPHKSHDEHRQCNPGGAVQFAGLPGSDNSYVTSLCRKRGRRRRMGKKVTKSEKRVTKK